MTCYISYIKGRSSDPNQQEAVYLYLFGWKDRLMSEFSVISYISPIFNIIFRGLFPYKCIYMYYS